MLDLGNKKLKDKGQFDLINKKGGLGRYFDSLGVIESKELKKQNF